MKITLREYINNPLGKGPTINASVKESVRRDYTERWNALMVRENGRVIHEFYYDKKHNVYYCHIKVPSEKVPRFYYDVVFRFFADESVKEAGRSLDLYNAQFFSNDPAFVFNYAHAFIDNDLFIRDLIPKMSREAVRKVAKEKNPQNLTGYVKAIYFAYLYMRDHGLFNIAAHAGDKSYNKKDLQREVRDADTVVENRQKEGEKLTKKKVKENNARNKTINIGYGSNDTTNLSTVKNVKKISSTNGIKKTSSVKQIGKR